MTSAQPPVWEAETRAFYERRGITGRVGSGSRPAVLVIDMTKAFTDADHPVGADQTSAVEAIARLLAVSRAGGVPSFFTTLAFQPDGSDAGVWGQKMPALLSLRRDDPAAVEVDDRIAPVEGESVLNKRAPSAFFGTGLPGLLTPLGIDTLIVVGCSTSGCVRASVIDAVSYGYRVIVPIECVSDRAPGPHQANLFDIDAKYGDAMPLDQVIAFLSALPGATTGTVGGAR
jgi:nicotinamidase-related amidase